MNVYQSHLSLALISLSIFAAGCSRPEPLPPINIAFVKIDIDQASPSSFSIKYDTTNSRIRNLTVTHKLLDDDALLVVFSWHWGEEDKRFSVNFEKEKSTIKLDIAALANTDSSSLTLHEIQFE